MSTFQFVTVLLYQEGARYYTQYLASEYAECSQYVAGCTLYPHSIPVLSLGALTNLY